MSGKPELHTKLVEQYNAGWVAWKRDAHRIYTRQIAELQSEIAHKDEEIECLKRIAYGGRGSMTLTIHSPVRFADEALKGPKV